MNDELFVISGCFKFPEEKIKKMYFDIILAKIYKNFNFTKKINVSITYSNHIVFQRKPRESLSQDYIAP